MTSHQLAGGQSIARRVTQYIMSHGCVDAEQFTKQMREILGKSAPPEFGPEQTFQLVQQINKRLDRFQMMIRQIMDENDTKKYYVLISKVDNNITQSAFHKNPKKHEFFKLLVVSIVRSSRGIVSKDDSVKDAARTALITPLSVAKKMMEHWCERRWFSVIKEAGVDYYTLGVRSMSELDVWIKQKLLESPNELDCCSCNQMAIYCRHCPECNKRFHKRCSKMAIDPDSGKCHQCSRQS